MMKFRHFCLLGLLFGITATGFAAELPSEKDIQKQIDSLKQDSANAEKNKGALQELEQTLDLLKQVEQQKNENDKLRQQIDTSAKVLAASKANIEKLKTDNNVFSDDALAKLSLSELQTRVSEIQNLQQQNQSELTSLNAALSAQKSVPERAQAALTENLTQSQQINNRLSAANISGGLKAKLETQQTLLDLQNSYYQIQLNGNDALTALYSAQVEEKTLEQQILQTRLTQLQTVINSKNLQESQNQLKQAAESQQKNTNTDTNPVILRELDLNTRLSEELLEQTRALNMLSQDNLRIKSVLDNLQQTQRNIEEQISALQGTLVLSRIINKQKQSLPQDQMIKGLSKQIADLRVKIFDITELRDRSTDTSSYMTELEKNEKTTFTDKERTQLSGIIQERNKILSDLIKQLNNQLNLSINIELNQQQVQTISDSLQNKLKQQSFWVKSNGAIDAEWFKNFFALTGMQLRDIGKKLDFSNWRDNIVPAALLITLLLALTALILKRKEKIKQRLTRLNNKLKSVNTDSQWHTPEAIFWTLALCLPSTFMFLTAFILVTYIGFQDPTEVWPWGMKMAGYWLYFAFMLAMLRPNGIAYRHFNMPPKSNETFRSILKRSAWVIALLLNTSIFTNLEMGVSYDVLGETMTMIVLAITVFIVAPAFRRAISDYQHETDAQGGRRHYMLYLARAVLLLAPIALIILIAMGYYYTSLVIIEHLIASYFAIVTWIVIRNTVYRGFSVSARRLAARRLKEKRELALAKADNEQPRTEEAAFEVQNDSLAVSEIKNQVLKITDFVLWIGLFGLLYWVWSDLVTVAYYLNGVTLWQQSVVTEAGTALESITLLNLLVAVAIVAVTYVLIRNIGGLLETLVFSHVKLSQGTPYTVTTLLTYAIIAVGGAFAFATLGMSWSKLQWLFAALSVGLGFGMQEIFANFVSGIIILFERPVRIGDTITIGQFSGTVSKIRIRATTLVDFDGKEVIVPNKAFVTERLVNWALSSSTTRIVISIGVAYGSDLEKVKALLLQAAHENNKVLKDPAPSAYFLSFGASTLDHELRVYVDQISDRNPTIDILNRRINQLFAENDIDIAFNQLDVFIKNQSSGEEMKVASQQIAVQN
ncbi:potassium efflux system protein [Mesocricetibacter intestinalis]|uniref:Potassium efflux system protein n=1 Tax=Mesocricetibacter intestinalis TaxID=1521930 RepID=A0A4R6VAP4_9PAST|nr:mechanosensitive channel MscK [Mesocricetibacter intestinalis]TDQ56964.1 potassium efflux system protein [Mesocricetibacter intestinalis]